MYTTLISMKLGHGQITTHITSLCMRPNTLLSMPYVLDVRVVLNFIQTSACPTSTELTMETELCSIHHHWYPI